MRQQRRQNYRNRAFNLHKVLAKGAANSVSTVCGSLADVSRAAADDVCAVADAKSSSRNGIKSFRAKCYII
jgi:hypothetical protein